MKTFKDHTHINELFNRPKGKRINDEMTVKQILLYVNKILKPYEISITSYRAKSYYIKQLYKFDELIARNNKTEVYYEDSMNILKQKRKPPPHTSE